MHDLLLALLLPSADDAAEDLAFNVGHGSVARFVGMMNARARQLGLTHTHYSTPIGLDTPGNYSSASDLTKLASFVLTHSRSSLASVALPRAVLHTGSHTRFVANRNDLVGSVPWVNGVKTGHTRDAGYVLVGRVPRGDDVDQRRARGPPARPLATPTRWPCSATAFARSISSPRSAPARCWPGRRSETVRGDARRGDRGRRVHGRAGALGARSASASTSRSSWRAR